jgi:hypothetical protein
MRIALIAVTVATLAGLHFTAPAFAQKLPSDVEQDLGIRPNSMNRDSDRRRRYDRALPSDVEQQMRRQANRRYQDEYWDDYEPRSRYRPARRQQYQYYYMNPY